MGFELSHVCHMEGFVHRSLKHLALARGRNVTMGLIQSDALKIKYLSYYLFFRVALKGTSKPLAPTVTA